MVGKILKLGYRFYTIFCVEYSSYNTYCIYYSFKGRVGQPLSLMLKQSPLIDELCVYDVRNTCAFAMELGHIDTQCTVSSYSGKDIMPALQVCLKLRLFKRLV